MTVCTVVSLATIAWTSVAVCSPRIVLLETFEVPVILEHTKFFLNAMDELGYCAEDIAILKAGGDPEVADWLLRDEIATARPDVVVANATVAAKAAFSVASEQQIPTVFFAMTR